MHETMASHSRIQFPSTKLMAQFEISCKQISSLLKKIFFITEFRSASALCCIKILLHEDILNLNSENLTLLENKF